MRYVVVGWGVIFLILTLALLSLMFMLFMLHLFLVIFVVIWYLRPSVLFSSRRRRQ